MSVSPTPYTLSASQLDAALAALAKATETFRLSRFERVLYRVTGIYIIVVLLSFATGLLILLTTTGVAWVGCLLLVVGVAASLAGPLLLLANLRVILKTMRQRRLLKQLGLREISYTAWKAHRKRHLFKRIAGAVITLLCIAQLVIMTWYLFSGGGASIKGLADLLAALFVFVMIAMPLIWRVVQRGREQMDIAADADRLRAMLTSIAADANDNIVVPAAVLEKVAGIEQMQIARERAQAVAESVSAAKRGETGYGVLIAREVSDHKALLPPESRLEVEELIDELVTEPQHGAGTLTARTSNRSAELDYSVDETNRRIHILALRTAG
jgi:hypothetical protein